MQTTGNSKNIVINSFVAIGSSVLTVILTFWLTSSRENNIINQDALNKKVDIVTLEKRFKDRDNYIIGPMQDDINDLKTGQQELRKEYLDEIKGLRTDFKDLQNQIIDIIKHK